MKIRIKYQDGVKPLQKISQGDWIDLAAAEDVWLDAGEMCPISLGVSMELPEGYEAIVAARSSTPMRYGIICANSIGIIDNSYCGDGDVWRFPAYAVRPAQIKKGDRIAQFRIQQCMPEIEFETVESLGNANRGGFGSTGR